MTKGAYTVSEPNQQNQREDNSFKSFTCAIVIFFSFCMIIVLLSTFAWKRNNYQEAQSVGGASELGGKEFEKTTSVPRNDKTSTTVTDFINKKEYRTTTEKIDKVTNELTTDKTDNERRPTNQRTTATTEANKEVVTIISATNQTKAFEKLIDTTTIHPEINLETTEILTTKRYYVPETTTSKTFVNEALTELSSSPRSWQSPLESTVSSADTSADNTKKPIILISTSSTTSESTSTSTSATSLSSPKLNIIKETTKVLEVTTLAELTTTEEIEDKVLTTEKSDLKNEKTILNASQTTDVQITTLPTKYQTEKTEQSLFEATTNSPNQETETTITERNFVWKNYSVNRNKIYPETTTDVREETTTDYSPESHIEISDGSSLPDDMFLLDTNKTTTSGLNTTSQSPLVSLIFLTTTPAPKLEPPPSTTPSFITFLTTKSKKEELAPLETTSMKPTTVAEKVDEKNRTNLDVIVNVCDNFACHSAASRMLSLMNPTLDPCKNFYEFACGGDGSGVEINDFSEGFADSVLKNILSTQSNNIYNNNSEYYRNIKIFYDSCLDYEIQFNFTQRIENVKNLLNSIGKFEFENKLRRPIQDIMTELFAELILYQSMPLFDVSLDINSINSNYVFQLTLPDQNKLQNDNWSTLMQHKRNCLNIEKTKILNDNLNLNEIYKSYEACHKNYARYLNSIENILNDLRVFDKLNSTERLAAIKKIRFSIEFDILDLLNHLPEPAEIRSNYTNGIYKIKKISELQQQFPFLNWLKFFETISEFSVQDSSIIHLYFEEYFNKIFAHFEKKSNTGFYNALLAIHASNLYENTVIPRERENRIDFCVNLAKKLHPDFVADILKLSLKNDIRHQNNLTVNVFKILKKKFGEFIQKEDWLDEFSKIFIRNKLQKIQLALLEPNDLTDNLGMNDFEVMEEKNYQKNLMTLIKWNRKMFFSNQNTKVTETSIFNYFVNPLRTESLTFYNYPIIAVPYGLVQRTPNTLPDYLIMARIGFHLAREIARHFDAKGIMHDMKLSEDSSTKYEETFKANSKDILHYASPRRFMGHNISFSIKEFLSDNERISENAAYHLVSEIFKDYKDQALLPWINNSYNVEEIFHIAITQEFCQKPDIFEFMLKIFESEHLPSPLRVENIVGNSDRFSEIFHCALGTEMNMLPTKYQFPHLPEDDYNGATYN